jgi:hypothetical protein
MSDGLFRIPPAPTYKEENFYYAVLQLKKNWAKTAQFAHIFENMAAAQVELKLRKDANLGVTFRVGKIVTSRKCDAWLPTGMSSPTYAIWNGEANTPPSTNGRHATMTEWVHSTGFNTTMARTGRVSSKKLASPMAQVLGKKKAKGKLKSRNSKP